MPPRALKTIELSVWETSGLGCLDGGTTAQQPYDEHHGQMHRYPSLHGHGHH
jgi:hypothetical protein